MSLAINGTDGIDFNLDAAQIKIGADDDLQIFHDGSNSVIREAGQGDLYFQSDGTFFFRKVTNAEDMAKFIQDGAVELYYDNSKKFETSADGVDFHVGSGEVDIYSTGSGEQYPLRLLNSDVSAGNSVGIYFGAANNIAGSAIKGIAHNDFSTTANRDGALAFMTRLDGTWAERVRIKPEGGLKLPDDAKIELGDGQTLAGDLQIYHDGSHSKIVNSTGDLHLASNNAVKILGGSDLSEVQAVFNDNGAVELYYDNVKKFETKSTGISIQSGQRECNLTLQNDARTWKVVNYDYGDNGSDHLGFHDGTADRLIIQNDGNIHLPADGQQLVFGTDDDLKIYQTGSDSVLAKAVAGSVQFKNEAATATTDISWRFDKTNAGAANNVRHNMFSFGLPGVNRGLVQCGSSNSESPIWAASSDYRIKENFRAYTGGWDAIKAIPVQLYDEKSPSYWTQGADKKDMKGWRAHEVQAVIPEAVTGAKDAVVTQALIDAGNQYGQSELNQIIPQQLGTTAMLPDVIGALQQAMTKIETLEAKVAALEAA